MAGRDFKRLGRGSDQTSDLKQLVQSNPTGLLSLLTMKGTGDAPHWLNPELQATLDLGLWYLEPTYRSFINPVGPGFNIGTFSWNVGSQVPANQMWIMKNTTWLFTSDATGSGIFTAGYQNPQGLPAFAYGSPLTITAGFARTYVLAQTFQIGELVLGPQSALGYWTTTATAGITTGLLADFYRIQL